ncbi:TetR/AcrR family transcriptional regulator [Microbacterium sp. NPDC055683]
MAWDTERTRALILEAAVEEFAVHGYAGARVGRIAGRAGFNVERLYAHFGDKRRLFETAVGDQLAQRISLDAVDGEGPEAIGAFASRLSDSLHERPLLARLVAWEGLELERVGEGLLRAERASALVDAFCTALPGRSEDDVRWLLFQVVALCYAWHVLPNLTAIILDEPPGSRARRDRDRVRAAATALAAALPSDDAR